MKALLDKLGYKPKAAALTWRVPETVAGQLADLALSDDAVFRIAFVRDRADLADAASQVASGYRTGGHLWIAYPKKSGAIRSDLDRDNGWEPIRELGLRPVTQIAVDADWTALRFRLREEVGAVR